MLSRGFTLILTGNNMQKVSLKSLELIEFEMFYFRKIAKSVVKSEFEFSGQKEAAKKYGISGTAVLSYANNGKLPDITTAIKILKKDMPINDVTAESSPST